MLEMESWGICEQGWRKGPWTPKEDKLLLEYVNQYGDGRWSSVSKCTGTHTHTLLHYISHMYLLLTLYTSLVCRHKRDMI